MGMPTMPQAVAQMGRHSQLLLPVFRVDFHYKLRFLQQKTPTAKTKTPKLFPKYESIFHVFILHIQINEVAVRRTLFTCPHDLC